MSPSKPPSGRRPRADAVENRRRILLAARELFDEAGPAVTMEQVARRAGVAKGTIFRHFPTRDALVAAHLADLLGRVRDVALAVQAECAPGWEAVAKYAWRAAEIVSAERLMTNASFAAAVRAEAAADGSLAEARLELDAAVTQLLEAAQRTGEVRADLVAADIQGLVNAVTDLAAPLRERHPDLWRRYLTVVLDGLRAGRATPITTPPIPIEELGKTLDRR